MSEKTAFFVQTTGEDVERRRQHAYLYNAVLAFYVNL